MIERYGHAGHMVLKLMRLDGIGGGTRRAERLLPAAKKLAKSNGKAKVKAKKANGAGAKVTDKEAAVGTNR